jgi:hypothetical protein
MECCAQGRLSLAAVRTGEHRKAWFRRLPQISGRNGFFGSDDRVLQKVRDHMNAGTSRWTMVGMVLGIVGVGPAGWPGAAQAQTSINVGVSEGEVDVGFFYDRLAPYGDWRQHPHWGWVWSPAGVATDWRPYALGRWVYTDDYGWLWDSDEDWGWACFHYGRWDWDTNFGWFWVPRYTWGPAWVAWRTDSDFIGWCPLPPEVTWQPALGLDLHGFDLDVLPARRWVFVPTPFFTAPLLREHVVLVSRNVTIFRATRPFTRFERVDGRIFDASISARRIEEVTHRPVPRLRVVHVPTVGAMRLPRERDGEIHVFSPRVRPGPAGLVPPRPGELTRRQEAERAQMTERQRAEATRQQQRHQAERGAAAVPPQQLQRRQQAEAQALHGEHERQSHQLENQQRRQRDESGAARGGPGARTPQMGRGSQR